MKRIGLEKARARVADAIRAFEALKVARNWTEFESAWTLLLTALNAAYQILGDSARGSSKSEGWFSKVLGQRRADELLSYMMHARNANDHGIADVIRLEPGGVGIGGDTPGKGVFIKEMVAGPAGIEKLEGWQEDGRPLVIKQYPARARLVPVVDRGVEYHPPSAFLGKPIADTSPTGVAHEALEFMVILLGEAEDFIVASRT
jgi:hypothetical protein